MNKEIEIESIFIDIKNILIEYNHEQTGNFIGLSNEEVKELEIFYNINFPFAYKYFLKNFSCGNLRIFDNQKYDLDGIEIANSVSKELLIKDKFNLDKNAFVFSQWQGYNFYYFLNNNESNPFTYLYLEGGLENENDSPKIISYTRFTDWFIELSIESMKLAERLYNWNTQKGVELAERLYSKNSC